MCVGGEGGICIGGKGYVGGGGNLHRRGRDAWREGEGYVWRKRRGGKGRRSICILGEEKHLYKSKRDLIVSPP